MVKVKDARTGGVVCGDALVCSSMWKQARGLMLSRRRNLIFVFQSLERVRLHMMFVFFPICVIGLDDRKRVVALARILPFQTWRSPAEVRYIIELSRPPFKLPKLGDRLSF